MSVAAEMNPLAPFLLLALALLLRRAADEVAEEGQPDEDQACLRDQARDAAVGEDGRSCLAQHPEAPDREQHHQHEHRVLRPERHARRAEETDRAVVRDGEAGDVPGDERDHLDVPDRVRGQEREVRLEAVRAEQVPAAAPRIGEKPEADLALVEEEREVVGEM